LYRFYFDGSLSPGFEIRHSEFGLKPPFITPLADKFLPQVIKDPRLQKIDFQIVRSFCPMPFWRSAKIDLENRGLPDSSPKISGTVVFKPASALAYPKARTGHFRTSAYQAITPKKSGRDSHVATLRGSGHVVAGLITAEQSMCEGDVRVHIDGCGTAVVESDGSESWACYGWGFEFPPQFNPASSYDGKGNSAWSMLRLLMGDFYPFRKSLRMTVEGGGGDESGVDPRSGVVFYYGEPEPAMIMTDCLDVGDLESEKKHEYTATGSNVWNLISALEGEFDDVMIADNGRTIAGLSQFFVRIDPENQGVILRRRSDQALPGQHASVYVDGKRIRECDWFYADRNPNYRWLEDEFIIPASYTRGKQQIRVRIEPVTDGGKMNWNESLYWVFSVGASSNMAMSYEIGLPEKALPAFEVEAEKM
jgi:hypothetical protein